MQMVPNLGWFYLQFFEFKVMQKWYTFNRNHTSNFEDRSFPGLATRAMVLSGHAVQQQSAVWSRELTTDTLTAILDPYDHSAFNFWYNWSVN